MSNIFDICEPRPDIREGKAAEGDYAADLAQVARNQGPDGYRLPEPFFSRTYPTEGLKSLLQNVCRRLSGAGGEAAALFRLDTNYGGGKTHGLIALVHACHAGRKVPNISEFVDRDLLPDGDVKIAVFDGENADPSNGRDMGEGVRAKTPWGEIAYALSGKAGYERVRASDEAHEAPGAETLGSLFGAAPTLILLDEVSVYLRKVAQRRGARDQFSAFLTSLFKAVESAPRAALVYTLAIGRDGAATDAYREENDFLAARMAEAESISARKATLLNPTSDDETVEVLRRRLFERIDSNRARSVCESYRELWRRNDGQLPQSAFDQQSLALERLYPFHPDLIRTLTEKTATLANFQRVRGMLRILARSVGELWRKKPADATMIHLHHLDLGFDPIQQEVLTKLGQTQFASAIRSDIAGGAGTTALADDIDAKNYKGLPPYAGYTARAIFWHTLAFNESLKGLHADKLRWSLLGPGLDIALINDARERFVLGSAYLDDRPSVPLRFQAEANIVQLIAQEERNVDGGEARNELDGRIKEIFKGRTGSAFDLVPFPGAPYEAPDDIGDGRPRLLVMNYDAVGIGAGTPTIPEFVRKIHERKGQEGSAFRRFKNMLVFLLADSDRVEDMKAKAKRKLALEALKRPDQLASLAEHQREKVKELAKKADSDLAVAIQQCYRHLVYPDKASGGGPQLSHTMVTLPSAAAEPGQGQAAIAQILSETSGKLRKREDQPDSPAYMRTRTPLAKGEITTRDLRQEYYLDPALPILIGDDVFIKGIRNGVERGEFVYRKGDLTYGQGDPGASIEIDEQAFVYTMDYAKQKGIWPRPAPIAAAPPPGSPPVFSPPPPGVREAPIPAPPAPGALIASHEGPIREALTRVFEQLRGRNAKSVSRLTLSLFQAEDAFPLLVGARSVANATKAVSVSGGYETTAESSFQFEFRGVADDVVALRDFLRPQFNAAKNKDIKAEIALTFTGGLSLNGDSAEKLTNDLAKLASGAAYVSAEAEGAA